jgi:ATP-dependent DNA helicase RecG
VATVDLKTADGQDFIEIHVDAYPYRISYKGQYHFRSGSTKQELSGNALNAFLLKKYGLHWDAVPVLRLTLEMLEPAAFKLFVTKAVKSKRLGDEVLQESHESILTKLQLLEGPHLKRAASLLFYDNPEQFVTGAYIKIGFFRTNTDLVYQDEIHGNLFL